MKNILNKTPVNIVFSTSDEYMHLLSVALYSLAIHANSKRDYNVYILKNGNLKDCQKQNAFLNKFAFLHIKYIDMSQYLKDVKKNNLYTYGYVSEETYYRFLLPTILNKLKKVIYADCDVVFCADVGELYDINVKNNIIAAAINISAVYNYNINNVLPDKRRYRPYFDDVLKLKEPTKYFQAGIAVWNLEKMQSCDFTNLCMKRLAEIKTPVFFDQDVLNSVCQNDVLILPINWNHVWYFYEYGFLKDHVPLSLYREYDEARKMPKIIHYAGPKPFTERHRPLAGVFWQNVMQTPEFEYFLKKAFGDDQKKEIIDKKLFTKKQIKPAFTNQISILMSSSNSYVSYLGVSLFSLFQHMDVTKNYDIIILETEIDDVNKQKILDLSQQYSNCSVRFINLNEELKIYNYLFHVKAPISKETYYRLFIDKLFAKYDRMIYIDADTLVVSDLTELYNLDIGSNWLAAAKDYVLQTGAKRGVAYSDINVQYYMKNVISLDYQKYVQCGVILFNLKQLRKNDFSQKAITMLQYLHNPRFVDQDVINKVCEDHIYYLSPKYNFLIFYQKLDGKMIDEEFDNEILEAADDVQIYHMPGGKPDMFPDTKFADLYFRYARQSPFYETLVKSMVLYPTQQISGKVSALRSELVNIHFPNINNHFATLQDEIQSVYINQNRYYFTCKKLYYKMKMKFSFHKKKRQKYKEKYMHLKDALKAAKRYKKLVFRF